MRNIRHCTTPPTPTSTNLLRQRLHVRIHEVPREDVQVLAATVINNNNDDDEKTVYGLGMGATNTWDPPWLAYASVLQYDTDLRQVVDVIGLGGHRNVLADDPLQSNLQPIK